MLFNYKINKFDISKIKNNSVMIIGNRFTGKSELVKNILYNQKDIAYGNVISVSENKDNFYSHIMPISYIHNKYNLNITSQFIKKNKTINKYEKDKLGFIVYDECLQDDIIKKDHNISEMLINHRDLNLLCIIVLSYLLNIIYSKINNIDYIFICEDKIATHRRNIFHNFMNIFPTYGILSRFMDIYTKEYMCLVIDNTIKSNNIDKRLFWYKPNININFKLDIPKLNYEIKNIDEDYDVLEYDLNNNNLEKNIERSCMII